MDLNELQHKKKTVADLIRFIGNTADANDLNAIKTPNYSLLLGSGASVTSGVRSGQALVEEWKQEVYKELNTDENVTIEEFFQPGKAPSWYEESNSYAALFENRYDLQRHRRMFVEREVSKARPSMGYAYLVKLIENGYFNTVFTTNFDDLLNEAFYRFSQNRPIVCAHDSSISGVTVTSTRPKIIKLHGDYLYENIKATLRETESLEANMKMKFQEFAKDFGLIVIGYSGQDRSIMDILNYLLQKEDYFKNGIFWCIRKGDKNISNELIKLLWKDRVYFVEIDGFDELFAELNYKLNDGDLPVGDSFLSRKHQETIIKDLTDNPLMNPNGKCSILTDDCKRLKNNFESNLLNDFLSFKKDKQKETRKTETKNVRRKSKLKEPTIDEKKELEDITTTFFILNHKNSALQKLSSIDIPSLEDGQYKQELTELKADLTPKLSDDSIKEIFNELIRLDPDNERYYVIAANRTRNHLQAIKYLEMGVSRFPNDPYIINELTERILNYCKEDCLPDDINNKLDRIDNLIKQSLSLYAEAGNEAYSYRYAYLEMKYNNDAQELKKQNNELLEMIKTKNPNHPNTLQLIHKIKPSSIDETYYRESINYYKKGDNSRNVERCYSKFIEHESENGNFEKVLELFSEFESDYEGSNDYKFLKASILMDHEYFEDALQLFRDFPDDKEAVKRTIDLLIRLGKEDEADYIYESSDFKEDIKPSYLSLKNMYSEERKYYEDLLKERGHLSVTEVVYYAYVLLQCKDYQSVVKILRPYYDNPTLVNGAIIVNYLFARKQLKEDIDNKLNNKMLNNQFIDYSNHEKLGAYCVLKDKLKALDCLQKVLKKEPFQKYTISKWPVMAPFIQDEKFKKLLSPSPQKL